MECRIATLEDIVKKYDHEIEKAVGNKSNWNIWKAKAIERFNKAKLRSLYIAYKEAIPTRYHIL